MHRRAFLAQLAGGSAVVVLSGCGGGNSSTTGNVAVTVPSLNVGVPSGTPTPLRTPPTDYSIDIAQSEIVAQFSTLFAGFSTSTRFDAIILVTSADALAIALATTRSTSNNSAAIQQRVQIVCDWTGSSILTAGPETNLNANNFAGRSDGHIDNGGGIYVVAAAGRRPFLANQVNISGTRGIHFDGIGFSRQLVGAERAETAYGAYVATNNTYPAKPVVLFTNCLFGARSFDSSLGQANWVSGIGTAGIPDYVGLFECRFNGHQSIAKLAVRHCRIDGCDLQGNIQDAVDLFGHTADVGYYAYVWITRSTFRNVADELINRSEHMDSIQTGTSRDLHLGYRCLYTDLVVHSSHSYAGDPGQGGGTQGFYNDDHVTADNQFVIRRCITLVSAPNGFAYFSPNASRPSFVDQCTFMRSKRVPSNFAGDMNPAQDFSVGITGSPPLGGPWLLVTRSIGMDLRSNKTDGSQIELVQVDPRNREGVPFERRPESVFKGRDFTRGGPAVNGITGKFGYLLANEGGSQAQFVADIWANFEPAGGFSGIGSPDPRLLAWSH